MNYNKFDNFSKQYNFTDYDRRFFMLNYYYTQFVKKINKILKKFIFMSVC